MKTQSLRFRAFAALAVLAIGLLALSLVPGQTVRADGGGFPTRTPTRIPTFTPLPTLAPTLPLPLPPTNTPLPGGPTPTYTLHPFFLTLTPQARAGATQVVAAASRPSGFNFSCFPLGLAVLLILIIAAIIVVPRIQQRL